MIQEITPQDAFNALKNETAILIDVREQDEWDTKHISYAQHWPLSQFTDAVDDLVIPDNKAVIFQCLVGGRSQRAAQIFSMYANDKNHTVYNMVGGLKEWESQNLPELKSF